MSTYNSVVKIAAECEANKGSTLTPYDDRECPIFDKIIDGELCYETTLCMQGQFIISSVPEAVNINIPLNT